MIEVNVNSQVETIESPGAVDKIVGISSAKSMVGWLDGRINVFRNRNNQEIVKILECCKQVYGRFHPVVKKEILLKKFKGESGIQIIKLPNCFETIQFRKTDDGIKEIRNKVELYEIIPLILVLKGVELNKKYKTRYIAQEYCKTAKIELNSKGRKLFDENGWNFEMFFGDRKLYCKFNIMLKILEYYEFIAYYKCGEIERLVDNFEVQGEFF